MIIVLATAAFVCASCDKDSPSQQDGAGIASFSSDSAAPGRVRADLAAYRIAYYEPVAADADVAGADGGIQESDEPFTITAFGPFEELPSEIKRPSLYAVFSQPVVPLAKLGDPMTEEAGLFAIDPPLTGVYRWYGTKLLSFEPDADVLPQQKYVVTVSGAIQSLGGKKLEGATSFSFETERLGVLRWSLGPAGAWTSAYNAPPDDARFITAVFSCEVDLDEIARWIEIRGAGKTFPFTLSRPEKIERDYNTREASDDQFVRITMNDKPPVDADMSVTVKAGARSKPGLLGSKEDVSFSFHTLRPFGFERAYARAYSSPRVRQSNAIPITVSFNYGVEEKGAERFFSINGIPALTAENVAVYGSSVVLNDLPLQYETDYTLAIAGGLQDVLGRTLGSDENIVVSVGGASSYVSIYDRGPKMLEAAYPARYVWETQNPLSISTITGKVNSPYERVDGSRAVPLDVSVIPPNRKHFVMEDLSPYLGASGRGTVGMYWRYQTKNNWQAGKVDSGEAWLSAQVTDIGITMRYAYNTALVWATRLSTGEPVANALVQLLESGKVALEGKTDSQGLAAFDFPDNAFVSMFSRPSYSTDMRGDAGRGFGVKVIENGGPAAGGDEAEFIPNGSHNMWRFNVEAAVDPFDAERERPVVFLFTDRGLYKPGETVTFRVIDRTLLRGNYRPYVGPYTVEVSTGMYNAKPIASLKGESTKNGGSYGSFTLPADLAPGVYAIKYSRANAAQVVTFTTANFEALRFEASLKSFDPLRYKGDTLSMHFSARYLAGGALSGAPYAYFWTRNGARFAPPAPWEYWSFGPGNADGGAFAGRGEGSLGPDGSADITRIAADDGVEGAPYSYRLEASVQDASRQQVSSRASVMVHPARFYIGTRLDEGAVKSAGDIDNGRRPARFLAAGKPATASWALAAPQGEADAAPYEAPENTVIKAQFIRYDWKQSRQAGIGGRVNVSWERVEEVVEEKTFSPGENTAGVLPFTPAKSGQWEIHFSSKDEKGRPVVTRMGFYVSGGGWVHWGSDDVDAVTLTPDKPEYAAGETAKLLVRSPLPKGNYLLTIEREGIIAEKIIELDGSARLIDIPVDESYAPIVYVAISSYTVRSGPPQNTYYDPDLDKPKGIFGIAAIRVDAETRRYKVEIEPQKPAYRPKDQAEVKVTVTLGGKPAAGAEITFMAVDRGVVDLIDYHVPDPLAYFYAPHNFPLGVRGADSRSLLMDPVTYALSDLQGGDSEDGSKMEERKDFRPTAVFEPYLVTGADGTVTVKFPLPDSLTTYRCTAVAAGVKNFGVNERDLRVSQPLNASIAMPRTLRWRDTGTVSLILTNLEESETTATVALVTENIDAGGLWGEALAVDGESEKTVTIASGDTAEVRFMVAAVGAGEARLTFTLTSPSVNERIIRTIAVDRPVVYETVSTIGNLTNERPFIEEGVVLPAIVPEGTGSLGVTLAASRLALLKDAVQYLLTYPYGCLEQRTAALLPLTAFGDHLGAFQLESPVKNPKAVVEAELAAIAKNRLPDGLYPYWPGGRYGNPMVSLRVAHIALLAKQKGYTAPAAIDAGAIIKSLQSYMNINTILKADPFLSGYLLWIRAMNGEKPGNEISGYLNQGDELGISGYGFAGLAAFDSGDKKTAAAIADKIKKFLRPGTRSVDLTDTYERKGAFWGSDVDRYAIALMLYYSLYPNDDMTTRLAASLIERQRRGVWTNTASSFWAVLAFGRIADAEAAEGANMRGIVTLDSKPFTQADFTAYGGTLVAALKLFTEPPLSEAKRDTLLPLRIERQGGSGSLYYGMSLRYGIPAELAATRDEGIGVFAETLDDNGAVVKDGRLIAGKTYIRRVTVSSSRDRTFLALRAPVPSGAEIVDATFVTSSTTPPKADKAESAWWDWVEPPLRFIMNDETRFHWDFFKAGRQTVEFRFRAVMPGVYPTPPAQAECMYEGEIFGRSAGELVRIEGVP
ncbi:MAG: alpha-2-macroglobulin [Treponema sp.]|nr:alpha-2-macroglobulin [Treponema sp.]